MPGEKPVIRVLFAVSEADPFIKVGGLADVAGSLPYSLQALRAEHGLPHLEIRLIMPYHPAMRSRVPKPRLLAKFWLQRDGGDMPVHVYQIKHKGLTIYLVDGPPISQEFAVYTGDLKKDGEKYTFFSLSLLELVDLIGWKPDILHAHDWHACPAVYQLSQWRTTHDFFKDCRSLLTIHNLPYMGFDSEEALMAYGISPSHNPDLPYWARLLPLPMGLESADFINAVSPSYSREIMTDAYGCGLEGFLQSRSATITGILNGIDLDCWNPVNDKALQVNFDADKLDHRKANKKALQAEFNLPISADLPLIIMVGRLDRQKGIDLAIESLNQINNLPWQAIVLGTGDPNLEAACRILEQEFPERIRAAIRFDGDLARRMYAGGDILLMPSRYEPCGLAQMIAMHYGCIPLARATGGLKDSIVDNEDISQATGFLFEEPTVDSMVALLQKALTTYDNPSIWKAMQINGMKRDFSWAKSAKEYRNIYMKLKGLTP